MLKRIIPSCATGLCDVLPLGKVSDAVPGTTGLSASPTVGLAPSPVPLVTSISSAVPVSVTTPMLLPLVRDKSPTPEDCARFSTKPESEMVGLPATPSPSATLKPVVPAAIERAVSVVALVLTCIPVPAATRLAAAPDRLRTRVEPAPLSTRLNPPPEVVSWRDCESEPSLVAVTKL